MKTFVTHILGCVCSPLAWLAAALVVCGAVEARAQGNSGTIKGRLVWGGGCAGAAASHFSTGEMKRLA